MKQIQGNSRGNIDHMGGQPVSYHFIGKIQHMFSGVAKIHESPLYSRDEDSREQNHPEIDQ